MHLQGGAGRPARLLSIARRLACPPLSGRIRRKSGLLWFFSLLFIWVLESGLWTLGVAGALALAFRPLPPFFFPPMSEAHSADLLALDTDGLKSRLSKLRRYL